MFWPTPEGLQYWDQNPVKCTNNSNCNALGLKYRNSEVKYFTPKGCGRTELDAETPGKDFTDQDDAMVTIAFFFGYVFGVPAIVVIAIYSFATIYTLILLLLL